jgi:multiple sugar transport system permease protein
MLSGQQRRSGTFAPRHTMLPKVISYLILSLLGLTMVVPLLWMMATSLKPYEEIILPNFLPKHATFENYRYVMTETELPRWYLNSLIVAVMTTVSVAFFDPLAGYVFCEV